MSESIQQRTGLELQSARARNKRPVFSQDELETLRNKKIPLGERFRMQYLALSLALPGEADRDAVEVEEELIQEVETLVDELEALEREIGAPPHLTPLEALRLLKSRAEGAR